MAYHVHNIPIPPPEKPGKPKPPIPDARLEQLRQEMINARDLFLSKALTFDKLDAQIINIDGSVVAQQQTLQNHVKEVQETHPYAKEKTLTDGIEELKQEIDNAQPDLSGVAKQGDNPDATISDILDAIPKECSNADINHMFETVTEDGLIIVPSGLITPEGTMPISVFKAITGLAPTE